LNAQVTIIAQSEALLKDIVEKLDEPNEALVRQVIAVLGVDRTREFLLRTQAVEAEGGLLTADGERRAPGGVFFQLVRKGIRKRERRAIFPKETPDGGVRMRQLPASRISWDEAQTLLEKAMQQPKRGEAELQIRLMGRPTRVARARTCVVCEMEGGAPPQLPKPLPILPVDLKLTIGVFISYRHWERVVDKLLDFPETELIIDGWPYVDLARNFFGIFAQNVTVREFQHLPPEVIRGSGPRRDPRENKDIRLHSFAQEMNHQSHEFSRNERGTFVKFV
jgi:hypothetical protein